MSSDDIVSRADSLMRRRRSFVATTTASAGEPLLSAEPMTIEVEEDIPVLTEEVLPETPLAAAPRERFDETLAARLASEFSHTLERRLAAELPSLVEASLAVLEADLRRGARVEHRVPCCARHAALPAHGRPAAGYARRNAGGTPVPRRR